LIPGLTDNTATVDSRRSAVLALVNELELLALALRVNAGSGKLANAREHGDVFVAPLSGDDLPKRFRELREECS
jgi:hypothetical protein